MRGHDKWHSRLIVSGPGFTGLVDPCAEPAGVAAWLNMAARGALGLDDERGIDVALQTFGSQVRERFQWGWIVGVVLIALLGMTVFFGSWYQIDRKSVGKGKGDAAGGRRNRRTKKGAGEA